MQFISSLSPDQFREALRQTHELWGGGLSLDIREQRQFARLAAVGPELFEVAGVVAEDGTLVGSLKKYYFDVSVDGVPVQAIGLGAIFTHPEWRQKGVAAELIQHVLREAQEHGCSASVLYSDIGHAYYERFGFRATPAYAWSLPLASLPDVPPLEVREANEQDRQVLRALHQQLVCAHPIATLRSEKSWKLFHEMNGIGPSYLASENGRPIGYFSCSPSDDGKHWWVEEFLMPIELERRGFASIRSLGAAVGVEKLGGWLVPSCAMIQSFDGYTPKPRPKAVPMVAALDPTLVTTPGMLERAYFPPPDHF